MSRAGIIFDFDGVIVDSEGLQFASYAQVLRPLGVEIDAEEYEREWIAAGQGPEYAIRSYQLDITADDLRRRKEPVYQEMLRARASLMPGVAHQLPALAASLPLALATNSNLTDTSIVLDGFALWPHFSAVVTREDYARRKPAPDAFTTAASRLGLDPARCVVVEDATKGVRAARAAGCPCVAIPHDFTRRNDFSDATTMLGSLEELTVDLVRQLVGD